MAIQLNATEERHAKDSVICDRNKGVAIHALLLSLLNRLGVAPMEGRKSTANGIGVNGAVTTAIHKARKAHMAKGHKETEDSVRAFVSPVWTHGIAPFLTFDTKADEWVPDWSKLEADSKLWASGEKSTWKAKRKNGNGGNHTTLSPPDRFLKWFDGMSAANQVKFLSSATGKKVKTLEAKS
jgi:hypothetical protein